MIFVDDLGNPEGPVLLSDGSWALVEMRPDRGCITHISADGKQRRTIVKTGRPNGMVVDTNGVLYVAESVNPPSLLRVTLDGEVEQLLTGCGNEKFLFPNDLCFGPDDALYMTDSGYHYDEWKDLTPEQRETVTADGRVYRIDLADLDIVKLDSGIPFANGIVFGSDDTLYVSATLNGMVYRYDWKGGTLGPREDFGNVLDPAKEGFRGPDGMAFDRDGDLYVTVSRQGDVAIMNNKGEVTRRIQLHGPSPTNVAFGPSGSGRIYVTEQGIGYLEAHDVGKDGLPLHPGPVAAP